MALTLGLLSGPLASNQAVPTALAAPAATPRAAAWLRLDQPAYRTGDCVRAELHAPGVTAATLKVAARITRDSETIALTSAAPGVFGSACLPLQSAAARPGTGVLESAAGDTIVALAATAGQPLALDTAIVRGGAASGRFKATIDPSLLSPAEQTAPRCASPQPATPTGPAPSSPPIRSSSVKHGQAIWLPS
jgi:hypothetical protein